MTDEILSIDKEQLETCSFKKPIYSFTDYEIRERNRKLFLAMLMGNNFQSQAKIIFNTMEGYREVLSTVWATTEKFILLNEGRSIPIDSIAWVEINS